jgi:hypothetical protein
MTTLRLNHLWKIMLALSVICMTLPALADPRPWPDNSGGHNGIPVRQGHHIEWQRASIRRADGHVLVVWSDTRTGNRDVYGQLLDPNGNQLWGSDGRAIVSYPYRQEDPEIIATSDNQWIVAWIDFRYDSTGDVMAQKLTDAGAPLWDPNGVVVDTFVRAQSSMVNETTVRGVSDGAGGAIIAWEDNRRGDPADIYSQRILANGTRGWQSAIAVTDVVGAQDGITADGDGNGNMFVGWNDKRDGAETNIYAAKITATGQTPWGPNGMLICGQPGIQSGARICPDGGDGCYMAWYDKRSAISDDVYGQHINGAGQIQWPANGLAICTAPRQQFGIRVATSINNSTPDGLIIVWEDKRANISVDEVYAQKISPSGTIQWTDNGIKVVGDANSDSLNPTGAPRKEVRLTSDLAGGIVCAWEDTRNDPNHADAQCDLYANHVSSTGALQCDGLNGMLVADGRNSQNGGVLRADGSGNIFIIYDDWRRGSQSIRYRKILISSCSVTADQEIVYGLDGDATKPLAVRMNGGQVGLVWQDARYMVQGIGLFYQIIDSTGAIHKIANGDTLVPNNEGFDKYDQEFPQVCSDGNGGFFVAYIDLRTGSKRVRVTHVNNQGQLMNSGAGQVVFEDAGTTDQIWPYCASDGTGGCYVAWSNYNTDYVMDAYVMRVNASCQPVWAAPVRLTTTDDDDVMKGIVSNPDGCCFMVWRSGSFGQYNISTARVCGDGTMTFDTTVCAAGNEQDNPGIAADGIGGAYFAWADKRVPYLDRDIYAQHLNAQGVESWTHNGTLIINDSLSQDNPMLAVDLDRNLLLVWESFNRVDSSIDLRGNKLNPNGQKQWGARGLNVCVGPGDQNEAVMFAEHGNGILMAWKDNRPADFPDIYGTHIWGTGEIARPTNNWWVADSGGVICNYFREQMNPTIAENGDAGFIAAWEDYRASGKEPLVNIWANHVADHVSSIHEIRQAAIPTKAELFQNYPNPFNPTTNIEFTINRTERVEVDVFNTLGQRVATLVNKTLAAGRYEIHYEAKMASGLYFYRLKTPTFTDVKKMTLIR